MRHPRRKHTTITNLSLVVALLAIPTAAAQLCSLSSAVAMPPQQGAVDVETAETRLEVLLDRLARVAQLYNDNALRFSCDEEITYTLFGSSGRVQDRRKYNLK